MGPLSVPAATPHRRFGTDTFWPRMDYLQTRSRDTAIERLVKTSVNTSVYSRVPAELSLWPLGQNVLAESPVCLTLLGLSTICLESAPFVFCQFVVFERFTLDLSLGPSFVH